LPNLGVYIPEVLNSRLQRLREKGLDLNASGVFRQALEAAVEAEEKALAGDRVARLVTRLRAARTPMESAQADGEAAGSQWAEDLAALSELHRVRDLQNRLEKENLDIVGARLAYRVTLELGTWEDDDMIPIGEVETLPESVPRDFFERALQPYHNNVHYTAPLIFGFLRGAVRILEVAEKAMAQEKSKALSEATARQIAALLGGGTRRSIQRKKMPNAKQSKSGSVPATAVDQVEGVSEGS
jgi:hypothetical protein